MNGYTIGQKLPIYSVTGYNYAEHHDNKIHSDEVASQYGFQGGLVPGVGVYAYLTHPVVEARGIEWLQRGAMTARFLKPIYHGEEAFAHATIAQIEPLTLHLELRNADGVLCAVGEATMPSVLPVIKAGEFPPCALPAPDARPAATIANLPVGTVLGSLDWVLDMAGLEAKFLNDVQATLPIFFGTEAVCHPAFYLAQANEILMANVKLGPWIHTGSEVQHYALPRPEERLSLRGAVAEAITKRGHEIVTLSLGLFGVEARPIARIRHMAIVQLRAA